MKPGIIVLPGSAAEPPHTASETKHDHIGQNVEAILAFYTSEEQKISNSQRILESISDFLGKPFFLGSIVLFVASWILVNLFGHYIGLNTFDPPPFHLLAVLFALGAFITSTVVLIKQNRLGKVEEQRAHLDLQVNLLTEQKVTKIINQLEELRRDLPMVKDRHDPRANAFQEPVEPHEVLAALNELRESVESSEPGGNSKESVSGKITKI